MRKEHFDPATCLKVFEMSAEYAQDREKRGAGGSYYLLSFCEDTSTIEMGHVAKRSNGTFWWFTTNPNIANKHTAGVEYTDSQKALDELTEYVRLEIIRVGNLHRPIFEHDLPEVVLRNSDLRACESTGSDQASFQAGMDWMLRSMGLPRRPTWAKYLVQHRDGSLTWYEHKPYPDHNRGEWLTEKDSRWLNVKIREKHLDYTWFNAIRRVK